METPPCAATAYRSIGARTDNNQLYGGRYMGVASVEWQRPITYAAAT